MRTEGAVYAIFIHCTVLIRSGVWPAPLLLGVYCVSITNNVGALTEAVGRGFVATVQMGAQYRAPHDARLSPPA